VPFGAGVVVVRVILGALIICHGLITVLIWGAPPSEGAPFNPSHSWALGDRRAAAVVLAAAAGIGFVLVGVGVLGRAGWWPGWAIAAGALAVILMILYFNAWLVVGLAISAAVLVAGVEAASRG
jgi:hypothetical protein